jgi:hypothetical protein
METEKARYVFRHYGYLMTMQERIAHKHLEATAKAMHGRTDVAAQTQLRNSPHDLRKLISDNPEILLLTTEGLERFVAQTVRRIMDEHQSEIVFNHCPRCNALARTPRARQCRFCGLDWHAPNS